VPIVGIVTARGYRDSKNLDLADPIIDRREKQEIA